MRASSGTGLSMIRATNHPSPDINPCVKFFSAAQLLPGVGRHHLISYLVNFRQHTTLSLKIDSAHSFMSRVTSVYRLCIMMSVMTESPQSGSCNLWRQLSIYDPPQPRDHRNPSIPGSDWSILAVSCFCLADIRPMMTWSPGFVLLQLSFNIS